MSSKSEEPYTYEVIKFKGGAKKYEVKGPGVVHWDSIYHHETERGAQAQMHSLNMAHQMGRLKHMAEMRALLGLTTFASGNEVILSHEAKGGR